MRYQRIHTAILLVVMVLNICKYQIPYLEYNLFNNYIVENLCVKKNEVNNSCQGKCFLEKRINLVNETDNDSGNQTEKKHTNWTGTDDYIFDGIILQKPPFCLLKSNYSSSYIYIITKVWIDTPCPPPECFV
ncbi:MAG: hypothetical protein LBQ84_07425 [Flavobacteriaceae bacterium]|jgi:hypothetical protein|nr:hypothetical protein [Flavobacteriaceae bacterium]